MYGDFSFPETDASVSLSCFYDLSCVSDLYKKKKKHKALNKFLIPLYLSIVCPCVYVRAAIITAGEQQTRKPRFSRELPRLMPAP